MQCADLIMAHTDTHQHTQMPSIIEALNALEEGLQPPNGRTGALHMLCLQPALVYDTTAAGIKERLEALASVFKVCFCVVCVCVMFLSLLALCVLDLRVPSVHEPTVSSSLLLVQVPEQDIRMLAIQQPALLVIAPYTVRCV